MRPLRPLRLRPAMLWVTLQCSPPRCVRRDTPALRKDVSHTKDNRGVRPAGSSVLLRVFDPTWDAARPLRGFRGKLDCFLTGMRVFAVAGCGGFYGTGERSLREACGER